MKPLKTLQISLWKSGQMTNCTVFLLMDQNIWGGAGLLRGNESVSGLSFCNYLWKTQRTEEGGELMLDWASVKHLEEYWLCYEKALTWSVSACGSFGWVIVIKSSMSTQSKRERLLVLNISSLNYQWWNINNKKISPLSQPNRRVSSLDKKNMETYKIIPHLFG